MLTTYNELQAAVLRWLARDDLADVVPDFITLGELRLWHGAGDPLPSEPLRLAGMRRRTVITAGDGSALLGPDVLELAAVYVDGAPVRPLDATAADALRRLHGDPAPGVPRVYAIEPTPLGEAITARPAFPPGTEVTLDAWFRPDALAEGGGEAADHPFRRHPQLYLYAALVEAAPYLQEDGRTQLWHGLLKAGVEGVNRSAVRLRRGAGLSVMRPLGATP